MAKILVVDDDVELSSAVKQLLTAQAYTVEVVHDGKEAIDRLRIYEYDLVILDVTLPDTDGISILRSFRSNGGKTPVLMLTGRTSIPDKEKGLDSGADDYLAKPFHTQELSARVRALLRRPAVLAPTILRVGDLTLDIESRKLTRNGQDIPLLAKEFALLQLFMRYPGQYFDAEAIMSRVWSSESETSPDAIRVHITKLRSKIDSAGKPSMIQTVRGMGYKLEGDLPE